MKFKTLLLGSAAAVAVTGAQAADLAVTEPVDYVRVCDAFGVGYHYIPGTDTCLKFGGRARLEVFFDERDLVVDEDGTETHRANWYFESSAMLNFTAKSMTEHGVLTGYVELAATHNNVNDHLDDDNGEDFTLDHAYVELGPFLAGRTDSLYKGYGAYTYAGEQDNGDRNADQVRLTWAMHGFGLAVSFEDPRDHAGTEIGDYDSGPAFIGAVTYDFANVKTKFAAGYVSGSAGDAWGAHANIEIGLGEYINDGGLRARVGYGSSSAGVGGIFAGQNCTGCSGWNGFVSAKWGWAPGLTSAVTLGGADFGAGSAWGGAANLVWEPYAGFDTGVEVVYLSPAGSPSFWSGRWRTSRTW